MTKEEVQKLFEIWKRYRSRLDCSCEDHHPSRMKVCKRETAWRAYVKARDELYGLKKQVKEFDIQAILDAFDAEHE
jgi:hypothetical protein